MVNVLLFRSKIYFIENFLSWVEDIEKAQYTDIHYRSMTGDGNFNWRMIFPIKFSLIEDMVSVHGKQRETKIIKKNCFKLVDGSDTKENFLREI